MEKLVYIAGKVTGEPIAECTLKFGTVQKQVQDLGFTAINPLEVVNNWQATWKEAMQKCITALMQCDAVLFLPDWQDSQGAKLEAQIAENFQLNLFHSIAELKAHSNLLKANNEE